jgi:hypothetical protein
MGNLTTKEIILLDKIIEKLDETDSLDGKAILEICGDDKMAETVCGILEEHRWIRTTRVDQQKYPIKIIKNDSFRMLLARIGNYAEQAKTEEQRFQPVVINATSSNIAVGNSSSINQTNSLSEKKSLIGMIVTMITIMAGIFTILAYYK